MAKIIQNNDIEKVQHLLQQKYLRATNALGEPLFWHWVSMNKLYL